MHSISRRTPSDEDYLDATVRQTCKVHTRLPPGGILVSDSLRVHSTKEVCICAQICNTLNFFQVFLPGQKEINYVCKRLRETYGPKVRTPPVLGCMSLHSRRNCFWNRALHSHLSSPLGCQGVQSRAETACSR